MENPFNNEWVRARRAFLPYSGVVGIGYGGYFSGLKHPTAVAHVRLNDIGGPGTRSF